MNNDIDKLYWLLLDLLSNKKFIKYLENECPEFDKTDIEDLADLINDFEKSEQESESED